MIFVLFHVLYSLGRYLYKRYHANLLAILHDTAQETNFHKQEACEMRSEVSCDKDAVLPKTQVKFSPPAYIQRYNAVLNVLIDPEYKGKLRKVVDFGCSELGFLTFMKNLAGVEEILCVDIDEEILDKNSVKAKPYTMDYIHRRKTPLTIELCCGSVTENDLRLQNMDAVICIELIEHMYMSDLIDFPHNIFGYIMPKVAIITTPNADFNVLFPDFSGYRHPDHKFEWTREQFQDWAQNIVTRYPAYNVTFHGICNGPEGTEELGSCTQMAVFHLESKVERVPPVMTDVYKTVARFEYPVFFDSRTDEQKILDEALYYINFLTYNTEALEEVSLNKVISFIKDVPITMDALKSLLVEHGMVVRDGEDGPVVLPFEGSTTDSESQSGCGFDHNDALESVASAEFSDEGDNPLAQWDNFGSHTSINEPPIADEESLLLQVPYTGEWNEESIVIPENRSVTLENTYLFDGVVYPGDEAHVSERPTNNADDTNCLTVNDTAAVAIEGFSSNSIPLTLDNELKGKTQIIQSDALTILVSAAPSSSSAANNKTTKRLVDIVTIEPPLSQEDELNLRSMQRASTLNCQPHLSVSRSSTSPEPLYLSFELNNSMRNYSTNQNESYQSAALNNTFCQAEMNEAVESVERRAEEDYLQRSKRNLLENGSNVEANSDRSLERVNITPMEEQVLCGDIIVADKLSSDIYSSSFQNQPKFTSSPRKMPSTLVQGYIESEDLVPVDSNLLTETIEKTGEMNIGDSSLANAQISNSVVGTIGLSTASSSGNDKNTDSKNNTDCSAGNKTQRESRSENREFSTSTFTENKDDRKFAAESSIIDHKTDVQNVDTYVLSSGVEASVKPEEGDVSALSKLDDINAKAYLDEALASDSRTSISKRCLSPPKEFLSSKLRRNSQCSSECAKEASVLDDKFVPSSSSEDTSSVQFASMSRNEENVTKEPGNRDVNTSSVTRLIDSVETKASSPLETPPNSWSPEIMDSGYPNTASAQDITPEYDLSSIAQDHIPDSESPSVAEAPRFGILEPVQVENGDLANNNRDDEGNNMMAVDADDNEDLQPFIDVLENDLENENDIYVMQNGFPMWLLRILEMANPLDFDVQAQQNGRDEDDAHYVGRDEGFDSSSSENESDLVYNEMENDNEHEE